MAGTYFDFANTPIEKDITLKAKWCCGGSPEDEIIASFYQGEGARVTRLNGEKGYTPASSYQYFNQNIVIPWYSYPDFSGTYDTIPPNAIKSVEFGKDGTSGLVSGAFNYNYYSSLELITGILDFIPNQFLYNGYKTSPNLLVKLEVTASNIGTGFITSRGNAYGQVIFNCPESAFAPLDKAPASTSGMLNVVATTVCPQTTEGFAIGGSAADYVLANFANETNRRNIYKLT